MGGERVAPSEVNYYWQCVQIADALDVASACSRLNLAPPTSKDDLDGTKRVKIELHDSGLSLDFPQPPGVHLLDVYDIGIDVFRQMKESSVRRLYDGQLSSTTFMDIPQNPESVALGLVAACMQTLLEGSSVAQFMQDIKKASGTSFFDMVEIKLKSELDEFLEQKEEETIHFEYDEELEEYKVTQFYLPLIRRIVLPLLEPREFTISTN